jgi:hypothetical protein
MNTIRAMTDDEKAARFVFADSGDRDDDQWSEARDVRRQRTSRWELDQEEQAALSLCRSSERELLISQEETTINQIRNATVVIVLIDEDNPGRNVFS